MSRQTWGASQAALENHPQVADRGEQGDCTEKENHSGWHTSEHVVGFLPDNHTLHEHRDRRRKSEDHESDVDAASGAWQRFNRRCRGEDEITNEKAADN